MHKPTFQELRELALSKRQTGILTIACEPLETVEQSSGNTADSFVESLGFKPLGKAWRQIERECEHHN